MTAHLRAQWREAAGRRPPRGSRYDAQPSYAKGVTRLYERHLEDVHDVPATDQRRIFLETADDLSRHHRMLHQDEPTHEIDDLRSSYWMDPTSGRDYPPYMGKEKR